MSKRKKKNKLSSATELMLQVRRTWEINPVTRTVPNKKAYDKKAERRKARKECSDYSRVV